MNLNFLFFGSLLCAVVILSSCRSDSHFEAKSDFNEGYWLKTEPVVFDFAIEDASEKYDLNYFIRNSIDYPYQNIYLQYYLEDSLGNVLSKKLNNIELFNSKTGKPLGNGVGDIYDIEKTFLEDFQFPKPGSYSLRIDQYMRRDTLKHIHTIGFSIKKNQEG